MKCIKKIKVDNTIYEANVEFKNAILCNQVAEDDTISDIERALGIIYIIFGDKGLEKPEHYERLMKWTLKYLSNGKKIKKTNEKPDMDYIEDYNYIWTSIYSDYNGLDIDEEKIDWHKFIDLVNGLSNSDFGNCCILNRIRNIRTFDVKQIKDKKERDKIIKLQKEFELKKYKKENNLTKEQEKSMRELDKILKRR